MPIAGDTLDENDETFTVVLSNPSARSRARRQGTGTIVDNDPSPSVSVNDVTIAESATAVNAVFTVYALDSERPLGDRQLRDGERHGGRAGRLHGDVRDAHVRGGRHDDADDHGADPGRHDGRANETFS